MTMCKRIIAVFLILSLCLFVMSACNMPKTDEEMIESRINKFVKAYNSGDIDIVMECLDAKSRNAFKSAISIGNALIGKTGFGIDIADFFGLGVGVFSDDDMITISDIRINMSSEKKAIVDVTFGYKDKNSSTKEKAFFTMVKEDKDWFIKDLESK